MNIDLTTYKNMNICVAVSGGRDSMALLHYLAAHGKEYGVTVCAVNFDHRMRGESSARDSRFVADYCRENAIPLLFYAWDEDGAKTEAGARKWRLSKYAEAVKPQTLKSGEKWRGADAVATAHHMNDNAETVLFNLARGSGIAGLKGICDERATEFRQFAIIRPLIGCTRAEIDGYIAENGVPFVDDETNFTEAYTRNKIRLNVLPELEKAVHGATESIYRFSRIAAEDEEFFARLIDERGLIRRTPLGSEISRCVEKPLFKRAALKCLGEYGVRDYAFSHLETLYALQTAPRGKKFSFCGVTAFSEGGKIALCPDGLLKCGGAVSLRDYMNGGENFCGQPLIIAADGGKIGPSAEENIKFLRFDLFKIPDGAEIRFARAGDRFTKFGGGTKSLGDYFTDIKLPVRVRARVPLIACGSEIFVVCGVEISEKVKIADGGAFATCAACDYRLVYGEK